MSVVTITLLIFALIYFSIISMTFLTSILGHIGKRNTYTFAWAILVSSGMLDALIYITIILALQSNVFIQITEGCLILLLLYKSVFTLYFLIYSYKSQYCEEGKKHDDIR